MGKWKGEADEIAGRGPDEKEKPPKKIPPYSDYVGASRKNLDDPTIPHPDGHPHAPLKEESNEPLDTTNDSDRGGDKPEREHLPDDVRQSIAPKDHLCELCNSSIGTEGFWRITVYSARFKVSGLTDRREDIAHVKCCDHCYDIHKEHIENDLSKVGDVFPKDKGE